jgi:tartrate-resistant acid phosphatase type 5
LNAAAKSTLEQDRVNLDRISRTLPIDHKGYSMSTSSLTRREVINGVAATLVVAVTPPVFSAARSRALNFLVVGDWGRDGTSHQREVAAQMGKAADSLGSQFVISVGDNFYTNGVQSTTDPQWLSSFESVYAAPSLQIPWYVALGNHDYRGAPQAQIDYSKSSTRWRMPARYYKVSGSDLGAPHADLFFIDTSPLVYKYREQDNDAIAANVSTQDVEGQLRWLDAELDRSTAPWKLVIGHHTLHSGGSQHGDTPEMVELIEPLLQKHGVQAYINGHDHDLQHVRRSGVNYIGSGAGSEVRPVGAIEGTRFCASVSGFAAMSLHPEMLELRFRDFTGNSLYHAKISPPASSSSKAA